MRLGDGGRGVDDKSGVSYGFGILLSKISNLIFDSSLQNFRPEFVHHSCSRASGQGNFRFAQFLTLNARFTLLLICLFACNHRGFDFCQIASIMIFNFLNSSLCALILKDWIMITLFCTCLFHWWIWSSRSLDIWLHIFFLQICMHPAFQGTDFTLFSWLDLIF